MDTEIAVNMSWNISARMTPEIMAKKKLESINPFSNGNYCASGSPKLLLTSEMSSSKVFILKLF
jgi:hypothetical protein